MRKLIRLVILGIVISVTWKYLDENDISVKEKVLYGFEWLRVKVDEVGAFMVHEQDDNSNGSTYFDGDRMETVTTYKGHVNGKPAGESINGDRNDQIQGRKQEDIDQESMMTSSYGFGSRSETTTVDKNVPVEGPVDREYVNPAVAGLMDIDNVFEWVKKATRIYSPGSWYMLMQYDELPQVSEATLACGGTRSMRKPAGTYHYLKGNTRKELLSRMSTNVHEIAHGYYSYNVFRHQRENSIIPDWDDVSGYIYITPGESYYVSFPREQLFPSRELAGRIPRSLRTFRFDTYITGTNSTQSEGVFGLLNELHAYYLGSKHHLDMLEAFKLAEDSDEKGVLEWIRHGYSKMAALYEFDYFISEYLLLMKSKDPDNYARLLEYRAFGDAYSAVRVTYEKLVSEYYRTIAAEMDRINNGSTHSAAIKDGYFWITEARSGRGTGAEIISEDKFKLLPVLKSDRYREVERDFAVVFPERDIYSKY